MFDDAIPRALFLPLSVLAGLAILLPSRVEAGDEAVPPAKKTYSVQVVDLETGVPVEGVTIRIRENVTTRYCYWIEDEVCSDCHPVPEWQTATLTTGIDGTASVDFTLPWCLLIDDAPPTWIKREHAGWEAPEVVENPSEGIYSPWILAGWTNGPAPLTHLVTVTREDRLAETFAPVLHAHRGLERQEDLGNVAETLDAHASLAVYNVLGQRLYGPSAMPPYHVWEGHWWDTQGQGTMPTWTRIDIDDDWRYRGAGPGNRPLYYHVFPHRDGAVVQYWLWFNANDPSAHEEIPSVHEGDWECFALYLVSDGATWTPQEVSFSQHAGGTTLGPDQVWWSATAAPAYFDVAEGFAPSRTHPHVWVAADSHALYSRFQPQYALDIDLLGCRLHFGDRVDYNLGGNPHGDHRYFTWDRLVDMGEYWYGTEAHGEEYFTHVFGGPLEWLGFQGRFGESLCTELPGCGIGCDFPLYAERAWAPRSPLVPEAPHQWRDFPHGDGPWGNDVPSGATVSYVEARQIGNYLGRYAPCADGSGDVIFTRVGNAPLGVAGVAIVTVLSGDIVIAEAEDGRLALPPSSDGWYDLRVAEVEGAGTVRFDIYPDGRAEAPVAENLICDIDPCGTSAVGTAERPVDGGVRIFPNPTEGGARFDFAHLPSGIRAWSLHDVGGRRITGGSLRTGSDGTGSSVAWSGRDDSGREVPSGLYFLLLHGLEGTTPVGTVTVTR
ncbi:MAG: hypothetical protein KC729_02785 [Candidatus Eisenbacteria bacterium]|uniref:Uncharacterized protein n=1 Tax=Eiseniibacteriota bacterium TaxID=2212470 RepID=A0A956LVW1_UNCEI|nr:hypothetical protein [Candidatus Eisenbacteria bacterium]